MAWETYHVGNLRAVNNVFLDTYQLKSQNPEIHGMWYSRLVGNAWLPLAPIISGPGTDVFGPSWPEAGVVQGNVLLAAWSKDVGLEQRSAPDIPTPSSIRQSCL